MRTLLPAWTLVLLSATSTFAVENSMIRHFVESSSAAVVSRSNRRSSFLNAAAFVSRPSSKKQQQHAILDGSSRFFSTVRPYGRFHNNNNNNMGASTYFTRMNSSFATVESADEVAHNNPVEEAEGSNNIITHNLNDAQKEATLRPRYSITRVIAGPGAGKTKVLTCRIAHLLLDTSHCSNYDDNDNDDDDGRIGRRGTNDEGILAVTFTKKAAMEMERRLIELLSEATTTTTTMDDDESSSSSGISTGEIMMEEGEYVQYGNADPNENDVNDSSRQLARRTTVGTFHSVCSKILRKFGKELGNLPSVRNCLGVTKNAAGATVSQGEVQTEDDDDVSFNEEEEGNSSRVLIQTLDGSFNILDQSDQLRLLKEVLQKHNIQLKSPASGSSSMGGSNDIRPITVLNAISLLNTRDAMASTTSSSRGGVNDEDDDVQNKVSKKVYRIAMEIRVPFQRAKYTQNSIDFDDLILLARELLLYHSSVREILHRRWRHVLVDEFQDTSRVQLDLVRLLTTNSLFAVGDGDQSIYSWRGASPESMSDFEMAFHDRRHGWEGLLRGGNGSHHHPNHLDDDGSLSRYLERIGVAGGLEDSKLLKVKSVYLMENYRSTTNIVKAAQRIISTTSSEKKFNNENPTSAQDDIRRDMKPMRGAGPSPRVLACKDARAEASFVVKTVNSMVDGGDLTPSSTVAMIYRTNAQSRLLEEACVEHNLRYVVRGSSGTFYKRAEIQDCMSFLKVVYNPRDRSAWARAVKAPSRGIGGASLAEFFNYCDAVTEMYLETTTASGSGAMDDLPSPMDVLLSLAAPPNDNAIGTLLPPREIMSTRSLNRFVPFAASLNSLMKKAEVQGVPDFLLSLIEDLGLKGHFDAISKTRDEYEDRLGNVMELVRAAERYKDDGPCITSGPSSDEDESMETPLGNFLDDVALIADLAPDESEVEGGGRIVANLMTIHSSKGMEFDAVFLVGNEDGTLPTQKSIAEGEGSIELSEERRLCYVAMTRAKTHLVLTWRREVAYFAGATFRTRDAIRSRFLDILVSKQKGKSSQDGVQKRSVKGGSNRSPSARKGNFKSDQVLGTMTKRELHSEADRYLNSSAGKSWDNWDPTSRKKQIAKRGLHNEANRFSSPGSKSWDDWEPTSQKKPIVKVPSIESNTPGRGVDRRQVTPSARLQNRPMQSSDDRRQVMPSSRTKLNSNGSRIPASSRTDNRAIDRRRIEPSTRTVAKERSVGKRPNRVPARESRSQDNNGSSLRGEPPPETDSTIFFPVGSPVKHNLHGRGIVQTPPNADEQFAEKMLVRVKFSEENMEWDLPMDGLVHTFD